MTEATFLPADAPPAATRKPRLLLAEDDPAMSHFLREVLWTEYEVEAGTDGAWACESAWRERPDVVLSNVRMPVVDGIELTRRLRADARTAVVPIVLLSACNRLQTAIEALDAGADDFLLKPFRLPELLARLRSNCRLAALRSE